MKDKVAEERLGQAEDHLKPQRKVGSIKRLHLNWDRVKKKNRRLLKYLLFRLLRHQKW